MVSRRCQEVPRVYFKRLLARPEYILKDSWRAQSIFFKDSWQEDYVIHMAIKDLHVAIVLSPICGPMVNIVPLREGFNNKKPLNL